MRARNKKDIIYGKAVGPNAGIRVWYSTQLVDMVKRMTTVVQKRLVRVYAQNEEQLTPQGVAMDGNIASQAYFLFIL